LYPIVALNSSNYWESIFGGRPARNVPAFSFLQRLSTEFQRLHGMADVAEQDYTACENKRGPYASQIT
jgi:hypothetical protein